MREARDGVLPIPKGWQDDSVNLFYNNHLPSGEIRQRYITKTNATHISCSDLPRRERTEDRIMV